MSTKQKNIYLKVNISYLYARRWQLVFLWGIYALLDFAQRLPYLGLVFTSPAKIIIFVVVAMSVLKLHPKNNFLLGILFIFFAIINILRGKMSAAEEIGIIVYGLLVVGFVQYFWLYIGQLKKDEIKN